MQGVLSSSKKGSVATLRITVPKARGWKVAKGIVGGGVKFLVNKARKRIKEN